MNIVLQTKVFNILLQWMVDGEVCIGLFAIKKLNKVPSNTWEWVYMKVHKKICMLRMMYM